MHLSLKRASWTPSCIAGGALACPLGEISWGHLPWERWCGESEPVLTFFVCLLLDFLLWWDAGTSLDSWAPTKYSHWVIVKSFFSLGRWGLKTYSAILLMSLHKINVSTLSLLACSLQEKNESKRWGRKGEREGKKKTEGEKAQSSA